MGHIWVETMLWFWPMPGKNCLCVLKVHLSLVLNLIYRHSSKEISEEEILCPWAQFYRRAQSSCFLSLFLFYHKELYKNAKACIFLNPSHSTAQMPATVKQNVQAFWVEILPSLIKMSKLALSDSPILKESLLDFYFSSDTPSGCAWCCMYMSTEFRTSVGVLTSHISWTNIYFSSCHMLLSVIC